MARKSLFITLEGGEGCGKSTQISLLADSFAASGLSCIKTREPGGSPGAEALRQLLVSGEVDSWDPVSETLLFYAARKNHLERTILPALRSSTHVLCDRFADSTRVYQGIGKGLSLEFIDRLHSLTLGNFAPDITFILDIDPEIGLKRAASRRGDETRFESMPLDFHRQIRAGFLSIAQQEPGRCVVIDAAQSKESVYRAISQSLSSYIGHAL
jgi:dTMP kinase